MSLFSKITSRFLKVLRTRAEEELRSLQEVSMSQERLSIVPEQEGISSLVHLTVLHHLQPLTVVPAELLRLDLLPPLLVMFLPSCGETRRDETVE